MEFRYHGALKAGLSNSLSKAIRPYCTKVSHQDIKMALLERWPYDFRLSLTFCYLHVVGHLPFCSLVIQSARTVV